MRIELGFDREARRRADTFNELHHGFVIDQRTTAPIFRDVTEQPMLGLVPFRRAGWKCDTLIAKPLRSAKRCSSAFHSRARALLLPPASAVMRSSRAPGYAWRPM
jgi:hypothetical protein